MKKTAVILLAALYLVMSMGFTTRSHYCRGLLVESMLVADFKPGTPCPLCTAAQKPVSKKTACCKHETELVRVTEKSVNTQQLSYHFKQWTDCCLHRFMGSVFEPVTLDFHSATTPLSDIPLRDRSHHLYILHCTYRI